MTSRRPASNPHDPSDPRTRTVLRGGRLLPAGPGLVAAGRATALGVEDGRIAWVGTEDDADAWTGSGEGAPRVVDLDGAALGPAFVDSHVHTVRTGTALRGLDLTGAPSLDAVLDALAAHAAATPAAGVLVGQGWDETGWRVSRPPTAEELERAAPGRRSYLSRVDSHSAVISPSLAALVPGLDHLDGATPDGRVERDAHHAVRHAVESLVSDSDRLDAARAACRTMAAAGIVSFHENAAPHIGPESEIALVRQAAQEAGLRAVVYWGELLALEAAERLGVAGLAGDLVADGAFGSRTAALRGPYADADTCGHAYLTPEQVRDHVVACTRGGLQAGFHCIGDAALDAIGEGFARAAELVGDETLVAARHRLEHVEMPSPATVALLARLGVVLSVQPAFDALWGGPDDMYAARLGARWEVTNPFGDLVRAGARLAFGSDSPVTPVDPWAAVRAATLHHVPAQRLEVAAAYDAHTRGGALAAGGTPAPGVGTLAPGAPADLATWQLPGRLDDRGWPALGPDVPLPQLRTLLAAGRTIHDATTEEPT